MSHRKAVRQEDRNGAVPPQAIERCEEDGQIWPCFKVWKGKGR